MKHLFSFTVVSILCICGKYYTIDYSIENFLWKNLIFLLLLNDFLRIKILAIPEGAHGIKCWVCSYIEKCCLDNDTLADHAIDAILDWSSAHQCIITTTGITDRQRKFFICCIIS